MIAPLITVYSFTLRPDTKYSYILENVKGIDVYKDIMNVYKKKYTGKRYITFSPCKEGSPLRKKGFYLSCKISTEEFGITESKGYSPERKRYYSDDRFPSNKNGGNALLFEFSTDETKLTIYIYKKSSAKRDLLDRAWTDENLNTILDALPLLKA